MDYLSLWFLKALYMPVLFCIVLQLILLGRNLHVCILTIAFADVAVD